MSPWSVMCNLFLSPWGVDKNKLIIFFVLGPPLFCSLRGNGEITEAGWIKIAEGVAASKSLQNLEYVLSPFWALLCVIYSCLPGG